MGFIVYVLVVLIGVSVFASPNTVFSDDSFVMTIINDDQSLPTLIDFEFYLKETTQNKQIQGVVGWIFLGTENYIMEQLHGGFTSTENSFVISGVARNSENKPIRFFVTGISDSHSQNKIYDIAVHIIYENYIHFSTKGEIVSNDTNTSLNMVEKHLHKLETQKLKQEQQQSESHTIQLEMQKKQLEKRLPTSTNDPLKILALIKDSQRREKSDDYLFSVKVYDESYNPLKEESVKGGELSNATITIMIIDSQGYVLREISDFTNEFGRLDGKILLGDDFLPGTYDVEYKIQYGDRTKIIQKSLYLSPTKDDENYRHFAPVGDIEDGFWNDNTGNQNGALWDDVDEYSAAAPPGFNDGDYIHSRNINVNQQSDTFRVKMETYGEVIKSHPHYISYRLGKETGGNVLDFVVKLYQGNVIIAQWTYPRVASLTTYTELLTPDQINSITNYHDLNLEFTIQCGTCISPNSNQRQGQVSWIHIFI